MKRLIFGLFITLIVVITFAANDRSVNTMNLLVFEPSIGGSDKVTIKSPSLSSSWTFTLPSASGTNGYVLSTNGSGTSSWVNSLSSFTITSPTLSGTITTPLTASRAVITGSSSEFSASTVTSTELARLSGIGSSAVGISDSQTLTNKTINGSSNTITNVSLTSGVTGTLPITNGGTGQTTANASLNAILPTQSGNSGKVLQTDGTNTSWQTNSASLSMGGGLTGSTVGSILYVGAGSSLAQDNSNLFYDSTNKRIGIGTASPAYTIDILKANSTIRSKASSGYGAFLADGASGDSAYYFFHVNGTENARISSSSNDITFSTGSSATYAAKYDSSQRYLKGATVARTVTGGTITPFYQLEGTNSSGAFSLLRNSNDSSSSFLYLGKTRGTTVGGTTVVNSGDGIGVLSYQASDGTNLIEAARVTALVDGTPGTNDMPGRLEFRTTADGASSSTERMRIDNVGNITFTAIHNNASPPTNTTQTISSGTYTPTLTNGTNVASSGTASAMFSRVGNIVTVSGSLEVDPTSADSNTLLGVSLPIASDLTSANQLEGVARDAPVNVSPGAGWLNGDTTNDRAQLQMWPHNSGNSEWRFTFQYLVQ